MDGSILTKIRFMPEWKRIDGKDCQLSITGIRFYIHEARPNDIQDKTLGKLAFKEDSFKESVENTFGGPVFGSCEGDVKMLSDKKLLEFGTDEERDAQMVVKFTVEPEFLRSLRREEYKFVLKTLFKCTEKPSVQISLNK